MTGQTFRGDAMAFGALYQDGAIDVEESAHESARGPFDRSLHRPRASHV